MHDKDLAEMTPRQRGKEVEKWGRSVNSEHGYLYRDDFISHLRNADRKAGALEELQSLLGAPVGTAVHKWAKLRISILEKSGA